MIGVTMQKPEEFRYLDFGEEKSVSNEALKRFALKLPKNDVWVLKIQPL
jgi:hypothetical protein